MQEEYVKPIAKLNISKDQLNTHKTLIKEDVDCFTLFVKESKNLEVDCAT